MLEVINENEIDKNDKYNTTLEKIDTDIDEFKASIFD